MNCRDFEKFYQSYLDNEFTGAEQQELEQHVKFCPVCKNRAAYETWFKKNLKQSFPALQAPQSLRAEIGHLFREERVQGIPWALKLAPVFAVALVFLGIFFFPRIQVSSPIVEATVEPHLRNLPFDVQSEDYQKVKSYLQDRVDYAVRIPRFRERSVQLVGGRVASFQDRSTAYVAFSANGRRYSMMTAPSGESLPAIAKAVHKTINNHDVLLTRRNGYNVAIWREKNLLFSLASDADEDSLLKMVGNAEFEF